MDSHSSLVRHQTSTSLMSWLMDGGRESVCNICTGWDGEKHLHYYCHHCCEEESVPFTALSGNKCSDHSDSGVCGATASALPSSQLRTGMNMDLRV